MHNKQSIMRVGMLLLLLLTVIAAIHTFGRMLVYDRTNPGESNHLYHIYISGQYQEENGPWKTLTPQVKFQNLTFRNIRVRGHLNRAIPKGEKIYLKISHLRVKMRLNGALLYELNDGRKGGNPTNTRGILWGSVKSPGITTRDVIEMEFGNLYKNAYYVQFDDLLWNMQTGDHRLLMVEAMIEDGGILGFGLIFFLLAVMLLISAMFCGIFRLNGTSMVLWLGLFSLSSGIWFLTLSPAMTILLPWPVFLTAVYACSMQGIAAFAVLFIRSQLIGWRSAAMTDTVCLVIAVMLLAFILQNTRILDLYDMINYFSFVDLGIIVVLFVCLIYESFVLKKQKSRHLFYMILPLSIGGMLELVNGYLQFSRAAICWGMGLTIFTIMEAVYTFYRIRKMAESEKENLRLENELIQSRISTMLSQIQPHFLYNALTTIHYLCDTQPEKASKVVEDFSKFLQGNMASLTQREPILFTKELKHLEYYVSIEQMRFDNLIIEYQIETTNFKIPALTIQPLMENAIRHGVTKQKDGGIICLSTWEDGFGWYIRLEDNGIGFRADEFEKKVREEEQMHVGIQNVRQRLDDQCRGTLQIESTPGVGTQVTIRIPKQFYDADDI